MAMKVISGTNSQILNKARAFAGDSFKSRVPAFTSANMSKTVRQLAQDPLMWNTFIDTMLNKVGLQLFHANSYENRLRNLKRGQMNTGAIIEEFGVDLLDEHPYDPADTNPFVADEPDVRVNWHKVNRRARFDLQINEDLLEEAMATEGQLGSFLTQLMSKPSDSDDWNEFLAMVELLGIYEREDSFANIQVSDVLSASDPEKAGKELTKRMREYYVTMKEFYNTDFNAEGINVTSSDLVVITTPKMLASLDVDVLAMAYHMDKADFVADRTVLIKDWPEGLEGTQALMVDKDFYVAADRKLKTLSQPNAKSDCINYFLHHWSVLSCSRMVNALRFSTTGDSITINTPAAVEKVEVALDEAVDGNKVLEAGADILLNATVTYDDGQTDADAYFMIAGQTSAEPSDGTAKIAVIYPDSGTYVDAYGVLHVADVSEYDSIVVTAVASRDNTKLANITLAKKDAATATTAKKAAAKKAASTTKA